MKLMAMKDYPRDLRSLALSRTCKVYDEEDLYEAIQKIEHKNSLSIGKVL